MIPIWRKKEFLTVVVDIVVSGATLAAGKWLAPDLMDVALWAVGAFQALSAVLVTHFVTETQTERMQSFIRSLRE